MAPLLEYFEWHIAVPYRSSKKVKMRLNVASDTCQQNTDMVNPCKSTLSQSETYTRWVSTQIWLRSSHFKTSLQKLEGFEDLPQVYRVLASVWLVCLNIFSSGNVVETWWNMVKLCGIGWAQLSSVRTPGGSNFNCCPAWLECLAWWWKCRIESFEPVPQDIPRRSNSWSMLQRYVSGGGSCGSCTTWHAGLPFYRSPVPFPARSTFTMLIQRFPLSRNKKNISKAQ